MLAWADSGSLESGYFVRLILTAFCLLLGLYTIYCVKTYFGMARAAGADHFENRYRTLPLVKEGIFKYTNNAMYHFGFLMLWGIAIGFDSIAALIIAAFSHIYVWVHYYATEKPDMNFIYGVNEKPQ